jgi:hypothetical protein
MVRVSVREIKMRVYTKGRNTTGEERVIFCYMRNYRRCAVMAAGGVHEKRLQDER